jgi:hypothetical protein
MIMYYRQFPAGPVYFTSTNGIGVQEWTRAWRPAPGAALFF